MSVIFASSTCDLSLKMLKKVAVDVIELPIIVNGQKSLYNADKFNFDEYYANNHFEVDIPKYKKLLHKKFEEALNTGQDVLFLTANAKYDTSYSLVNEEIKYYTPLYPEQKIEMVNCHNYGLGYGLIVYEAGIANMHGESLSSVVKFVNKIKRSVKTYIIPSTTANIDIDKTFVGGMIGVRPVLEIANGELKLVDKVRGKKNIVNYLYEKCKFNSNEVPLAIMCGKNTDEANTIESDILSFDMDRQIIKASFNPLLLSKFGDRTIAISFYKKSKS